MFFLSVLVLMLALAVALVLILHGCRAVSLRNSTAPALRQSTFKSDGLTQIRYCNWKLQSWEGGQPFN